MTLILIGILLIMFFYLMKTDFSGYPDSHQEYRNNIYEEEELSYKQAIEDMNKENYSTSLLKYDNFFKETYW